MWELYAMWTWIGVFLQVSFQMTMNADRAFMLSKLATFAVIASGGFGCVIAGWLADRWGKNEWEGGFGGQVFTVTIR